MFNFYWEISILVVYIIRYMIWTLVAGAYGKQILRSSNYTLIACELIFVVDIIKNFCTGYYDTEESRAILKPSKIAKKYVKTYFFIDLLSLVPMLWHLAHTIFAGPFRWEPIEAKGSCKLFYVTIAARYSATLKIFRLFRCSDAFDLLKRQLGVSTTLATATKAMLIYYILTIWVLGVIILVQDTIGFVVGDANVEYQRPYKYYEATVLLLLIFYGEDILKHPVYSLCLVIFVFIGFCLQIFFYATVLQTWKKFQNARNNNQGLLQQFKEYMKYKALPVILRNKIFDFFTFKYQNQFYNEAKINAIISRMLKQEMLMYITKNHIQKVEFFKNLPAEILTTLVSRLGCEIFLNNDTILVAGLPGDSMYFIYYGTVAVYSPEGTEICHLYDGAHFGEIALIYNEPRVASVVAITPCEIFILKRKDFLEVITPHPQIKDSILKFVQARLKTNRSFNS